MTIGVAIIISTWGLLKEIVWLVIAAVDGVITVHQVHILAFSSHINAFSGHIEIANNSMGEWNHIKISKKQISKFEAELLISNNSFKY